jgi:preprotein translocase subunit SecE
MKKPAKKGKKKKSTRKKNSGSPKTAQVHAEEKKAAPPTSKQGNEASSRMVQKEAPKPVRKPASKKTAESKTVGAGAVSNAFSKVGQFLREAKTELKKVKWPTRKELLASTAVVIVLTLFIALFLGLIDFGLIKIIKTLVN